MGLGEPGAKALFLGERLFTGLKAGAFTAVLLAQDKQCDRAGNSS